VALYARRTTHWEIDIDIDRLDHSDIHQDATLQRGFLIGERESGGTVARTAAKSKQWRIRARV
jgi:hypothetical protein